MEATIKYRKQYDSLSPGTETHGWFMDRATKRANGYAFGKMQCRIQNVKRSYKHEKKI